MTEPVVTESPGRFRVVRHAHGVVVFSLVSRPEAAWFPEVCLPSLQAALREGEGTVLIFADIHEVTDFEPGFRDA